ncbi:hypothetical protein IWQ55_000298 [Labrenzia sp. EL_208]|nr:hypothetical protein [Labrenzia sp. EL_132]MBG6227106.1 hypothetical protein [Labrenzia sp. EL_208]
MVLVLVLWAALISFNGIRQVSAPPASQSPSLAEQALWWTNASSTQYRVD